MTINLHDWGDVRDELLLDRATAEALEVVQMRKQLIAAMAQKRRQSKITQEKIAGQIGVSKQAISKFESGNSSPTLDVVFRYADALNIDLFSKLKQAFA
ncbi:helix-turn-helix domain-containing protein [Klebsiella sp. BIGb0407]|uniref:helix-turn-helix domain-containing protein n=1 Tax=Klebsiella sp. BIGb0407 TaxID=2940603 RepID=UPI0021694893|nr:helix-turn-helix transcriptional regulator [Klebsiella sp. BIGb0407]MCS3433761.1 DNA-binding XRE family transcriptional regulator [Klebsiella sp. BIGb0407]